MGSDASSSRKQTFNLPWSAHLREGYVGYVDEQNAALPSSEGGAEEKADDSYQPKRVSAEVESADRTCK